MFALVKTRSRRTRRIDIPFEEFLGSSYVRSQAKTALCTPEDLLLDHLPPFDPDDQDEIREAFSEACEQATDGQAERIRLDHDDLRFVQTHLIRRSPTPIPFPEPLDAA